MKSSEAMLLCVLFAIVASLFSYMLGQENEASQWKREAIIAGHAEYIAHADGSRPSWQWKAVKP